MSQDNCPLSRWIAHLRIIRAWAYYLVWRREATLGWLLGLELPALAGDDLPEGLAHPPLA